MEDLTIRIATPRDRAAIESLAARLADFDLPAWRTPGEIAEADARAMMASIRAGSPDDEVLIAQRNSEPVGCLHMQTTTDFFGRRHAHISVIATSASAEGTGVGRALMSVAESWTRRRGLSFLTLNVFAGNARARRFYERAGFEPETLRYAKVVKSEG
jgi:ribosomal protein S18 acetylase RimI-like enzyme